VVAVQLQLMSSFTLSVAAPKDLRNIYKKILREFQLYSSFKAYMAYIADASIIKNHDYVAPLLGSEWLNPKRFNLVIVQETGDASTISCPLYQSAAHAIDQEKPTVILIHQGAYYYEPIHRIYNVIDSTGSTTANKTNLVIDKSHPCAEPNNRASKIIQTYLENCRQTFFDPDAIPIRTMLDASAHIVKAQIINFNLHVVGFYTKTNVIVPLKRATPMDPLHASFFMFIDTCLKDYKHALEERFVKGVLSAVNKIVPGYYQSSKIINAVPPLGQEPEPKPKTDCAQASRD